MAEKSVGRRATRRRSIEPGRIQALGEIVNPSSASFQCGRSLVEAQAPGQIVIGSGAAGALDGHRLL
jgi:hypothetical protein